MDTDVKQHLEGYVRRKVFAALIKHSVMVTVTIDYAKAKICIDIASGTLTLYSIGSDPFIRLIVQRLQAVCKHYYNWELLSIKLTNSKLTPRPIHFDPVKNEFRSWIVQN
jgi:hypothetical protein